MAGLWFVYKIQRLSVVVPRPEAYTSRADSSIVVVVVAIDALVLPVDEHQLFSLRVQNCRVEFRVTRWAIHQLIGLLLDRKLSVGSVSCMTVELQKSTMYRPSSTGTR